MGTVPKKNKKNIFAGRILEIEGVENLKVEQAFELSDASAERSAAGCAVRLNKEPIIEYLTSNIVMLKWMIAEGYGDARTMKRRIASMEAWLANPVLMEADEGAQYLKTYEIDLADITEPILCYPNDPDDAKTLSEIGTEKIDEVFIGSCMTNIGHFRAAGELLKSFGGVVPTRLWVAPPTKMDEAQLTAEGFYSVYGSAGARTEMPGCSLCMGTKHAWQRSLRWCPHPLGTSPIVWARAQMSTSPARSWPLSPPSWGDFPQRRSTLLSMKRLERRRMRLIGI